MIDFTFGGLLRSSGSRTRQFVRLRLEALEDRFTPAYFTVTTVGDEPDSNPGDGIASIGDEMQNCTLRAAIQEANAFAGDDTILFGLTDPSDPENPSWTISIRSTLEITSSIGILSPYPEEIWVRRDATAGRFRVFDIAATGSAYMSGITIVNGDVSGHGGGVLSRGGLTMENCAVIANSADEGGGGISSSGHL
ncbi:MAG TPA: CSLREA domain-containing protein, partial [Fimbriiglobus sp.]|nr:CSLREA domain-containing protein [Fimbriiglobus sp.]